MLLEIGEMTDEELLLEYGLTFSNSCFTELYDRYYVPLYGMLFKKFPHLNDQMDDLIQEVWKSVHLKHEQFHRGESFQNWIMRIADNVARMTIRGQHCSKRCHPAGTVAMSFQDAAPAMEISDSLASPADALEQEDILERMRQSLSRLPEHQREVVELVYFQGLDYRSAGELLGVDKSTVDRRIREALKTMRDELS